MLVTQNVVNIDHITTSRVNSSTLFVWITRVKFSMNFDVMQYACLISLLISFYELSLNNINLKIK